ncbi:MAG: Biopolymer transport protein ExbB [Planctomycetota bacterium]
MPPASSTGWFRTAALAIALAVVLSARHGLIEASTSLPAQTPPQNPPPAAVEEKTDPNPTNQPGAIPTDLPGIAKALGLPFTLAFIAASVMAVWSIIERLVVLRKRRVIPPAFVENFLSQLRTGRLDRAQALALCQQNTSPMADIFLHGVRKWGRPGVEVEQAVLDGGERQVSQLRKGLRVLNGVSTLSPLIGLLGTVVGMIQSFNDIATAGAMGQTETLAKGIAMALLTTAVGLLIAIPAMAAWLFIAGRVDAVVMEMDRLGQELVNLISAEALRDRAVLVEPPSQPAQRTAGADA